MWLIFSLLFRNGKELSISDYHNKNTVVKKTKMEI